MAHQVIRLTRASIINLTNIFISLPSSYYHFYLLMKFLSDSYENTHSFPGEIWIDLASFLELSDYHKNKETREYLFTVLLALSLSSLSSLCFQLSYREVMNISWKIWYDMTDWLMSEFAVQALLLCLCTFSISLGSIGPMWQNMNYLWQVLGFVRILREGFSRTISQLWSEPNFPDRARTFISHQSSGEHQR